MLLRRQHLLWMSSTVPASCAGSILQHLVLSLLLSCKLVCMQRQACASSGIEHLLLQLLLTINKASLTACSEPK